MTDRPDFLVIGAARSGTTALASFLGEHPDVFVSTPKEPHFLAFPERGPQFRGLGDDDLVNRPAVRGLREWEGLFRGRGERRRGEGSVTTLCFPETSIAGIQRFCPPECRFVVMLRDPVDRAYSSWLYLRSRGYDAGSFEECLQAEEHRTRAGWSHMWQLRRLSRYADQLAPFLEAFGDRVLVVIQEEFAAEPVGQFRRILEFLDVDPGVTVDVTRRVNEGGTPRSRSVATALNVLRRSAPARRLVRSLVPERRREQVRSASLRGGSVDAGTRSALAAAFTPDIRSLEQLLGRDLRIWPSATALPTPGQCS